MISSNAYNYINVLDKAADASWTRNDVLANNIANADTPNYKRKDVQFETYLSNAIAGTDSLDETVANIDIRNRPDLVTVQMETTWILRRKMWSWPKTS